MSEDNSVASSSERGRSTARVVIARRREGSGSPISLRRELDTSDSQTPYSNSNDDLSTRSREELEDEIKVLRATLSDVHAARRRENSLIRDALSHASTGKSEDYLHLNQTKDEDAAPIPSYTTSTTSTGSTSTIASDSTSGSSGGGSDTKAAGSAYTTVKKDEPSLREILGKAGQRALGGGLPGALAMGIQVGSLMWLRTTMNYQYRYGTTTGQALRALYKDGGIPRFYRGVGPALIQGPLSRFGDTAANAGTLALLDQYESTKNMPVVFKTMMASGAAALWRINLMPVDTVKTIMQVEGKDGFAKLMTKVRGHGPTVFYHGALAASTATFVGHFPWFFTHNFLQDRVPQQDTLGLKLLRNAAIGFSSSLVADTTSNSIRVVKTAKQASTVPISYQQVVRNVIAEDGVVGLFGRGLKTRLLANGLQGMLFTVLWKALEEQINKGR